jgi:signal transduction histidine kinase
VANAVGARDTPSRSSNSLIETFETSIRTLKGRESEMRRLRDVEKGRADELAAMTATLVRSISSGFIALDADGTVVDMNQEARELLSVEPGAHVAGQSIATVAGSSSFARVLRDAVQDRETLQRMEVSELSREQVIGLTTVPLLDERGHCFGMLALFTDLTLVRKLERQVRDMQSLADLGEMSAGIAHEFRNSLSTILGYLRLARNGELPPASLRSVDNAEREASQLAGAVDALLAYGRPMKLDAQPTDVYQLMQDVVARIAPQHDVPIACDGEEAIVNAEAPVLARAFENLVRNAVESVEEKGSGDVRVSVRNGRTVEIRVEDSGTGIDDADVPRLFLPFQSNKSGGYGIGLALVKKIVLLHEGRIRLTGRPGEGATAIVELPEKSEG